MRNRRIVGVAIDTLLVSALEVMAESKHILCPVNTPGMLDWSAFVDILDVVAFVLRSPPSKRKKQNSENAWHIPTEKQINKTIQGVPVSTVLGVGANYVSIDMDTSLGLLVDCFARPAVFVSLLDSTSHTVTHIVSQHDLVRLVASHPQILRSQANTKVSMWMERDMVVETGDTRAYNVLSALYKRQTKSTTNHSPDPQSDHLLQNYHHNHAAAIVQQKKVVASFGLRDIQGITAQSINRLALPVAEFLRQANQGSLPTIVTCTDSNTLREAIEALAQTQTRQVWVLDEHDELIGCVTTQSVISALRATREQ
eukprot:c18903_g1_i3.p1 GENE.c18903_g1_i3~~c18903_g1_i3.p1  ORF type:complete len:312 (+),score=73.77 c18903_g1_i3:693-1628(+)